MVAWRCDDVLLMEENLMTDEPKKKKFRQPPASREVRLTVNPGEDRRPKLATAMASPEFAANRAMSC